MDTDRNNETHRELVPPEADGRLCPPTIKHEKYSAPIKLQRGGQPQSIKESQVDQRGGQAVQEQSQTAEESLEETRGASEEKIRYLYGFKLDTPA